MGAIVQVKRREVKMSTIAQAGVRGPAKIIPFPNSCNAPHPNQPRVHRWVYWFLAGVLAAIGGEAWSSWLSIGVQPASRTGVTQPGSAKPGTSETRSVKATAPASAGNGAARRLRQ